MRDSKVLIVAENPFSLGLMADLMEANEIVTFRARSATEALDAAQRVLPDLVVLDLEMPAKESRQFVDGLSRRPGTRDIPVMAVADREQQHVAEGLVGRLAGRIEKPIDTGAFPRVVIREIRRHTTQAGRHVDV